MEEWLRKLDPRTVDPNDLDSRIAYDQLEDKWIFEDPETGEGFEFEAVLQNWIPLELTSEENFTEAQKEIQTKKKLKLKELKEQQLEQRKKVSQQTAVFVSNLPLDIDLAELKQVFSKYGVIAQDLLTLKPKIKLYTDEHNKFKGEALIVYLKPESVDLVIQILHGTKLRVNGEDIVVEKAQFKDKTNDSEENKSGKRHLTLEERNTIKKRLKALNDRIENWNGDDDKVNPKWLRTVVIKRAFTLEELKQDKFAKQDVIEDIREGCQSLGDVENVILFDREEEGVVLVSFKDEESATKCIEQMDGRYFGGQKLITLRYNGEHFDRSENDRKQDDNTQDEEERLNDYINQVAEES